MKYRMLAALVALSASAATADEVVLQWDGKLTGIVRSEDAGSVTVEVGAGFVTVYRKDIKEIKKGPSALAEFYERAEKVKDSRDVTVLLELGKWAQSKRLEGHAGRIFEKVLRIDSNQAEARQALGFVLHENKWMTRTEQLMATGHILFRGRWVTKAEQEETLKKEEEARKKREEARQQRMAAETKAYEEYLERYKKYAEYLGQVQGYRERHGYGLGLRPWGYTTYGSYGVYRGSTWYSWPRYSIFRSGWGINDCGCRWFW